MEELIEIPADEVLARIESGDPVIYDHVAIDGDLDLSRLSLPLVRPPKSQQVARVVASRIQIRNCQIKGSANFDSALFQEAIDWSGTTFHKEARFKGSEFSGQTVFEGSSFLSYATFKGSRFREARFTASQFSMIANFGGAIFEGSASFASASFSPLCTNFGDASFKGEADFTRAKFPGTANFRESCFFGTSSFWLAEFGAEASFQQAAFSGYVSFLETDFRGDAEFRSCRFLQDLNCEMAEFGGNAVFLKAFAGGNVNFQGALFCKAASFQEADLRGEAGFASVSFYQGIFKECQFGGGASFYKAGFARKARFEGVRFQGNAAFDKAAFDGPAAFEEAKFVGSAAFSDTLFQGETSFERSEFFGDATFHSAKFKSRALFTRAKFSQDARLLGAEFDEVADFTSAECGRNLILENARFHTLRLKKIVFGSGSQVSLSSAEFNRLEVRWSDLQERLVYDGAAYLALVRNFKNLEWFEDADDCYYCYRRKSHAAKKLLVGDGWHRINWSKILDWLAFISCGYGVRPGYTVFLSSLVIAAFALLFWSGNGIIVEQIKTANSDDLNISISGHGQSLSLPDYLYFSAMVFTAKSQVKWYPVGIYRYLATLESVLGWLLMALFLVTLGRIMIR